MLDRQKQVSFCDHQVPICYYSSFVLLYEQFLPTLSNGHGHTTSTKRPESLKKRERRLKICRLFLLFVLVYYTYTICFLDILLFFLFQIFDESTGEKSSVPMTFWSVYGEKVSKNKEKRFVIDAIKQNG